MLTTFPFANDVGISLRWSRNYRWEFCQFDIGVLMVEAMVPRVF